jgi:hypothetical protein
LTYSTKQWEICQQKKSLLIKGILNAENHATKLLKNSVTVAIGFVDGNLELLWNKQHENKLGFDLFVYSDSCE